MLFLLIATVTPFISILHRQQAAVQIDTSRLTGAHPSYGRRQGCHPCSLPVEALAASREPHCAHHDRIHTTSNARPTLHRHVPRLIVPLLFPANAGATLTPPSPYPVMLGGLQGAPTHVMPYPAQPYCGNPDHTVTRGCLCPSTPALPSPPLSSFLVL